MKIINVKKGDKVVSKQDKVMEWYLIQKGTVSQKFEAAEIDLSANAIIGLLENDWFICDYVAKEDCSLIVINCKDSHDLQKILKENPNFRPLFLRSAIMQRHKAFGLYSRLHTHCNKLHSICEQIYSEYEELCCEYLIPSDPFSRMETLEPVAMNHQASDWEIHASNALTGTYFQEYMQLMMKDDSLTVGAIMEAGAQMRRVTQGIEEMNNYLFYNRDLIYSDSEDDLFHRIHSLAAELKDEGKDPKRAEDTLIQISELMDELDIYTDGQLNRAKQKIYSYDTKDEKSSEKRMDISKINCSNHILNYAGYSDEEAEAFKKDLDFFREIPDKSSLDSDAYAARRRITKTFYDAYKKVFLRTVEDDKPMDTVIKMFMYFGFMDTDYLGEEYLSAIAGLTERIDFFRSERVFTIYDWLLRIYNGEEEPSISELDQSYDKFLVEEKRVGNLTAEEAKRFAKDRTRKVQFEIDNMFTSGHRITYGRVTSFCPVLSGEEMISAIEKMSITYDKLSAAINEIRQIDYGIFFHEDQFSDPDHGITNEKIMYEILPNCILMPTVGTKAMMWQECAGIRSNTPARFIVPIFSSMDLTAALTEVCGRYRWEYCKHIMGARWNDIREKCLTAEYTDYLQFYKKNHDISTETKEKIKAQLSKCKNNYREVYVRDYINWIKFESKGGFRLNKAARAIMVKYCPFGADLRAQLSTNPAFENTFRQINGQNMKAEQRLVALYDKYEKAGGELTPELRENLMYYQM